MKVNAVKIGSLKKVWGQKNLSSVREDMKKAKVNQKQKATELTAAMKKAKGNHKQKAAELTTAKYTLSAKNKAMDAHNKSLSKKPQ